MKATVSMALAVLAAGCWMLDACHALPFKGTRTYNLESEVDRYGRYERVLLGLRTSEGLRRGLDPALLEDVRRVLLQEERQQSASTVDVHLGRPVQSRHIAQLLYRAHVQPGSAGERGGTPSESSPRNQG